jgi:hypothetical protein
MALLGSHRIAARDHFAAAFQLDSRDPEIILSYTDFVDDPGPKSVLLRNYLLLARGSEDQTRLEDVAARLAITEKLGPRPVAKLVSPYARYRVKMAGYFPNGRTQTGLVVRVSLNNARPLRLILDSGADGIFVTRERARSAGLERLVSATIGGLGNAAVGNSQVALSRRVSIGELEFEDCLVQVMEKDSLPEADGVIGMNVFENFLVRVDPDSRTLDLVPFDEAGSAPADMVRAYRVGHLVLVRTTPLKADHADRYFMLDTGASFSASASSVAAGLRPGEIEVRGAAGPVHGALRGSPMRLSVEGHELLDEQPVKLDLTELSRHEGVEISGIIGYPLLSKSAFTINYRDGLVRFGR